MELWQLALLTAVGTAAGAINVMAGGGSLLSVPVMLFLGLPGPVANGTNRISIIAQNIVAVRTFFRRGFSDFRLSLTLAAAAAPGAVLGALVGVRLEGEWFDRILAVIMLAVLAWNGFLVASALLLGVLMIVPYSFGNWFGALLFRPEAEKIYRMLSYAIIAGSVLLGLPVWD